MKFHFLFLILLIIIIFNIKFIHGRNNNNNDDDNDNNISEKQLNNCFIVKYYDSKDTTCSKNSIYSTKYDCGKNDCIQVSPKIISELNYFVSKFDLSMIIYCDGTIDFYSDHYCNNHEHSLNVLLPRCFPNKLNHPPFNIDYVYCNENYINEYNNNNENAVIVYFFIFIIIASIIFKYFSFHDLKKIKFF